MNRNIFIALIFATFTSGPFATLTGQSASQSNDQSAGQSADQSNDPPWYLVPRADLSHFTHQDTLRGSVTPERAWWDLTWYHLDIQVDMEKRMISGTNTIAYTVLKPKQIMQIDLQSPLLISEVTQDGESLEVVQDGNAWFVKLVKVQQPGSLESVVVSYWGKPREAIRAPWDGGFSWSEDSKGTPFVATSNQGLGASVWWPCKDHMYDEPDSMMMSFTVPRGLVAVGNGRLAGEETNRRWHTFHWKVNNPINNYGVNLNIGDYVKFEEVYEGENGPLDCIYYVLRENEKKAREHFRQVPGMMEAFEHWFGPYPFYDDSYKLVEAPYLGMEHQSSVTYGNGYKNGYRGYDLSGSGWGMKFDFIIIHETGHEWFANSITYSDIADMWIHESFTNYSESLYVEYLFGKEAGYEYIRGMRRNILNDIPVIGIYDVNVEGSGDMYYKGSNMLHTIRQLVDDDEAWRGVLRGLNEEFYHTVVTTADIEQYMSEKTGLDLQPVFNQYLRTTKIPTLEYYFTGGSLFYRWINVVDGFAMPVEVTLSDGTGLSASSESEPRQLTPTQEWKRMDVPSAVSALEVAPDYFVGSMRTIQ